MTHEQKIKHLYRRAGFGIAPTAWQTLQKKSVNAAVKELFRQSETATPLHVTDENEMDESREKIKGTTMSGQDIRRELKNVRKESREQIKELNTQWLNRMGSGQQALREKMTLFWHGHFACQSRNAFFVQQQNNVIRKHALGKFSDLLTAISQDPAMLAYLNNRQNRKDSPNENFAREVMELFTLGRGHYTETDVKNAARAFTGWQFKPDGRFFVNEKQHDSGEKTFLGTTGKLTGQDVLRTILDHPKTAYFVTWKICRYLVSDEPDENSILKLAETFRNSGYDIAKLLKEIFTSDWFYESGGVGQRIKSPVELLAEMQLTFGLSFQEPQNQLFIQKVLGQTLFYPPNVAGWPGGKTWIDSSSLMFRLQLPSLLFKATEITVNAKPDGDVNTDYLAKRGGNNFRVTADWKKFGQPFNNLKDNELLAALVGYLLPYPLSAQQRESLLSQARQNSIENKVKTLALAITSLPEYQLC